MINIGTTDDRFAASLRGFGLAGILAILVILASVLIAVPISAILVLAWVELSKTPWSKIGYVRPKSWLGTVAIGVAFGIAFKLFMKSIVMPLLGVDPINHTYHYLVGNPIALPAILLSVIVIGGFCEETVFRGYLFERLGTLFGGGLGAKALTVLITTGLFASAHFHDQGLAGVQQAIFTGAVFGTIFAATGQIWMLMIAHAAFDVTAIAIIYWNLESQIAHLFFK
ncbi:MAG TPA: CPBP family intramembrane glutamic endopeptidase [Candidatus Eremiobacteraceae bacterium]